VPTYQAASACLTVSTLTPYQVPHDAPFARVVQYLWRRYTHEPAIDLTSEAVEVGSEINGDHFVHGPPFRDEGTSQVTTDSRTLNDFCDLVRSK
jgi:hypothetical protein